MGLAAEADFQVRKAEERLRGLEERRQRLLAAARQAAAVLRSEFGASRVWVFGSVLRGWFHEGSDLDLAAEGIDAGRLGEAWDRVCEIAGGAVDLVGLEEAPDALRRRIFDTGELIG